MIFGLNKTQYKNFSLLTISNFFFFCSFSSFFLLPIFIKKLGGDEASIGYIMGSFGITSLGSIPLVSYLIDKYGRKNFIVLGSIVMFVSSFFYVFVTSISSLLYLLRFLQGFGFAFFFTSVSTSVSDNVPQNIRAHGLGVFGAFTIASYAVGPPIGEFIIQKLGFDTFFLYASAFCLISLILALFSSDGDFEKSNDRFALDFFRLIKSERYSRLFLTNLIVAGGLGSMLNFFSVYLRSKGLAASIFFLTYTTTVILVRIFGSKASDRYDRKKIASPCLIILSLSLIFVFIIDSFYTVLLISFLFSLGYGFLYPTLSAIVIDRATSFERGKAMGAFNASFSIGINYMAFPLGVIAKNWGFPTMYLVTGIIVFLGFMLFTFFEGANKRF